MHEVYRVVVMAPTVLVIPAKTPEEAQIKALVQVNGAPGHFKKVLSCEVIKNARSND